MREGGDRTPEVQPGTTLQPVARARGPRRAMAQLCSSRDRPRTKQRKGDCPVRRGKGNNRLGEVSFIPRPGHLTKRFATLGWRWGSKGELRATWALLYLSPYEIGPAGVSRGPCEGWGTRRDVQEMARLFGWRHPGRGEREQRRPASVSTLGQHRAGYTSTRAARGHPHLKETQPCCLHSSRRAKNGHAVAAAGVSHSQHDPARDHGAARPSQPHC